MKFKDVEKLDEKLLLNLVNLCNATSNESTIIMSILEANKLEKHVLSLALLMTTLNENKIELYGSQCKYENAIEGSGIMVIHNFIQDFLKSNVSFYPKFIIESDQWEEDNYPLSTYKALLYHYPKLKETINKFNNMRVKLKIPEHG